MAASSLPGAGMQRQGWGLVLWSAPPAHHQTPLQSLPKGLLQAQPLPQ